MPHSFPGVRFDYGAHTELPAAGPTSRVRVYQHLRFPRMPPKVCTIIATDRAPGSYGHVPDHQQQERCDICLPAMYVL
jgi:hypothetical protein